MNNSFEVAVLIPIYKEEPDRFEIASLKQCIKVLQKHPIFLFAPESLKLHYYEDLLKRSVEFKIERFPDKYFASVAGYNKLLLKDQFYKRFKTFKYILIHQLDAWVFSDNLLFWCKQQYAYIGAPWFSDDTPANGLPHFMGIGNGGFSLRNVNLHLRVLNKFSYILSPAYLVPQLLKDFTFEKLRSTVLSLSTTNNTHQLLGKNNLNEDVFWHEVSKKFDWFNMPDMLPAAQFATETNCEKLYNIHRQHLPFGCHAWQVYEPEFWSRFIIVDKVA